MKLQLKDPNPEPSIDLWLKYSALGDRMDEASNQVMLMDGDNYLGFLQWTPHDGLYFYSSVMKGDTMPLYCDGQKFNGWKQERDSG